MTISMIDILNLLKDGGVLAAFVIFITGCLKKWWVFGWTYTELKEDRDEWKDLALSGTNMADRAIVLATGKKRVPK